MATRGKYISDIELRLTAGKPSDDLELERAQIGHWLDVTRDELVKVALEASIKKTGAIDPRYVITETCKAVTKEDLSCVAANNERFFITLSNEPMSLLNDLGIVKVVTDEYNLVYPANINSIETIKDLPFAAPSEDNLIYHREDKNIIIYGVTDNIISDPTFIVSYIPIYENSSAVDADEFIIDSTLAGLMLDQVEEIGRRQIMGMEQDIENNSTDEHK